MTDREFDVRAYDQGVRDGRHEAAAENAKLRAALELWHLATKINVTMEGPQYMGVSFILGRQAWERTRAALTNEKEEGK